MRPAAAHFRGDRFQIGRGEKAAGDRREHAVLGSDVLAVELRDAGNRRPVAIGRAGIDCRFQFRIGLIHFAMLALERFHVILFALIEPWRQTREQARFFIYRMRYAAGIEKTNRGGDGLHCLRLLCFVFRAEPFTCAFERRQAIFNAPVTSRQMLNGAIDGRRLLSDFDHCAACNSILRTEPAITEPAGAGTYSTCMGCGFCGPQCISKAPPALWTNSTARGSGRAKLRVCPPERSCSWLPEAAHTTLMTLPSTWTRFSPLRTGIAARASISVFNCSMAFRCGSVVAQRSAVFA